MSSKRKKTIAEVARRYNVPIYTLSTGYKKLAIIKSDVIMIGSALKNLSKKN